MFAAITMAYNEPYFLPLWVRHYGAQLGYANLFVVDHGSDDRTRLELPAAVNIVRIPRSAFNDEKRAAFVSEFASSLLTWFDGVVFTDTDEFLVADPRSYAGLAEYLRVAEEDVVTAIGINVHHDTEQEGPLNGREPVLRQRRWARFSYPMCKPSFSRRRLRWTPGFHFCDHPTRFHRLFNFHLNAHDISLSLQRLRRTREMAWANAGAGDHQRWDDAQLIREFNKIARLPRVQDSDFSPQDPLISDYVARAEAFTAANPNVKSRLHANIGLPCAELIEIPEAFRDSLPSPPLLTSG